MSVATHCHGCGTELPPVSRAVHNRKWCSERCRKQTLYGGTCIDCGAPTGGSDGRSPNASKRCVPCGSRYAAALSVERAAPKRQLIERLWAEGKTSREIAAIVGWGTSQPGTAICILRNRGYNLPHRRTPEQIARITADGGEHLRRARAVLKAAA